MYQTRELTSDQMIIRLKATRIFGLNRMKCKFTKENRSYHVVGGDKWIINSDELNIISLQSYSGDQTADPSES